MPFSVILITCKFCPISLPSEQEVLSFLLPSESVGLYHASLFLHCFYRSMKSCFRLPEPAMVRESHTTKSYSDRSVFNTVVNLRLISCDSMIYFLKWFRQFKPVSISTEEIRNNFQNSVKGLCKGVGVGCRVGFCPPCQIDTVPASPEKDSPVAKAEESIISTGGAL